MEKKIEIQSSLYNYEVIFEQNIGKCLAGFQGPLMYVIDRNLYELYNGVFQDIPKERIYLIDAMESQKNIGTVLKLIAFWQEKEVHKDCTVLCFGGGITQDITTFACNIYLRNLNWYFFPSTLLAMCDSCIGGKCGINSGEYKNQLGVFYPPRKIFIHTDFLNTLTRTDYLNGWGELLKFSLTENSAMFEALNAEESYIPCGKIEDYIYQGLMVKKSVIEQDEFEGGLRRVLNYGHTFGHALESYTGNAVPHGTAVIWGIDVVNYIAVTEGILAKADYLRIKQLIMEAFIREEIVIREPDKLFSIIRTDKKVKNGLIYLAVLNRISALSIHPMEINEDLKTRFFSYLEETHEAYSH